MRPETWLADEVTVTVSGILTTHHVLRTATGTLGSVTVPALKMTGTFHAVDGRELTVKQTNWWRGTYELREGETILGVAHPRGAFRRQNTVQFGDHTYQLRPAGFWGRVWLLLDQAGYLVLSLGARGVFLRGATLRVVQSLDLDLLVFTYYLVNARWKEQSGAIGASAAAGT